MFNFLNFFSSGASIFSTGASLFNTYAQVRASRERASEALYQQRHMLAQQQGYNILQSGIGITATDSAGLLLRHQAYMDEMHARSVEAKLLHQRPRSSFNQNLLDLNEKAIKHNISSIRAASPWQTLGTVLGGVRDLASISRTGE